jgi:hypothetical protein
VLAAAIRGVYPREMLEPVPLRPAPPLRAEPRTRSAAKCASPRAAPQDRLRPLNLMEPAYAIGDQVDVIFCRNVLIYFDKPTQKKVVSRLVECLAPGGYLFVGHSDRSPASICRSICRQHHIPEEIDRWAPKIRVLVIDDSASVRQTMKPSWKPIPNWKWWQRQPIPLPPPATSRNRCPT